MATDPIGSTKPTTIEQMLNSVATKEESKRNVGDMGKDQFLNLLITQLRYQDPMNPVQDKEFIGQMAQFSALEQMKNLNASFESVTGASYLGKVVKATVVDKLTNQAKEVNGRVENVKLTKDGVVAVVGGQEVPITKISQISQENLNTNVQDLSKYTGYIGFKANGVYADKEGNELKLSGFVREIHKGEEEEMAVIDSVEVVAMELKSPTKLLTTADRVEFLESNKGKEITVSARNDKLTANMPIVGTLNDYKFTVDGRIVVLMNGIQMPVNKIDSVIDSRY